MQDSLPGYPSRRDRRALRSRLTLLCSYPEGGVLLRLPAQLGLTGGFRAGCVTGQFGGYGFLTRFLEGEIAMVTPEEIARAMAVHSVDTHVPIHVDSDETAVPVAADGHPEPQPPTGRRHAVPKDEQTDDVAH